MGKIQFYGYSFLLLPMERMADKKKIKNNLKKSRGTLINMINIAGTVIIFL